MRLGVKSLLLILVLVVVIQGQRPASLPASVGIQETQSPATVQKSEELGEGEVIRISANLISVPVTVINRQGQYVIDLKRNDFRVYEDREEQTIAHFSNVERPFSVILLIDVSGSTKEFLDQIKRAAKSFVAQLRPSDTVRIIAFHGEIKLLTKAETIDPDLINEAIDQIKAGPIDLGTRLYDAVDLALDLLKPDSRRKAVVLFTDGENTWGKATMKETLQEAEELDIIFYTLQYGDRPFQKYLQQLAAKTGGRYFRPSEASLIGESFARVAAELRQQYLIGYYPSRPPLAGEERKIKVTVNRKKVAVRARQSYVSR